jgi:hypothetical protein
MSVTNTPATSSPATVPTERSLLRPGAVAAVVAAALNVGVAALARVADVSLEVPSGKDRIPVYAFAQVTLFCAALGIGLAMVLRRRIANPHRVFVATTVALSVVSLVPPFLVDADAATVSVLCATHVLAAAIIIPVLAARLPRAAAQ